VATFTNQKASGPVVFYIFAAYTPPISVPTPPKYELTPEKRTSQKPVQPTILPNAYFSRGQIYFKGANLSNTCPWLPMPQSEKRLPPLFKTSNTGIIFGMAGRSGSDNQAEYFGDDQEPFSFVMVVTMGLGMIK